MILKNKIILGGTGFLVASGTIVLVVILATSDNEPSPKAKVKTKLDVSTLSSDSFKVSGTQTLGMVNLKNNVALPEQIELKYFVGANAPANDKSFNSNKPSNLKNGDIVYIKFFIKKASIANHEFKNKDSNPIKFLVSGLPLKTINHSLLIKDSFVISGSQTKGTIIKKAIVTFPSQVEAKYFKGANAPSENSEYLSSAPISLINGNKVHIKFFIKSEYIATHKFADDFTNLITIPITNLPKTEIDSSLLVRGSFLISGSQTKGTISNKTSATFPSEVEAQYFKGANAPSEDSEYLSSAPISLINGDKVHIKFFIKSEYIATHKFADDFTNLITIPITNLPKTEIDSSLLVRGSFLISGSQTKGTIIRKTGSVFPSEVEAKYFKGANAPNVDSEYEPSAPTSLINGNKVHIKFFIKSEYIATHKFADDFTNSITIPIIDLKIELDRLSLADIDLSWFTYNSGNITTNTREKTIPDVVQLIYAVQRKDTTNIPLISEYQSSQPQSLANGDKVYVKYGFRNNFKTSHQFPSSYKNIPLVLIVKNNKFFAQIDVTNLNTSAIKIRRINSTYFQMIRSNLSIPIQIKIESNFLTYKEFIKIPRLIHKNYLKEDIMAIRFVIKKPYSQTHTFPKDFKKQIQFRASSLKNNY